jgi:hypothetical protein
MRHTRQEVIERTLREFKLLDRLVAKLSAEDWERLLPRPETKDPWTVKDALAHITYFKADVIRSAKKQARPVELRGLNETDENRLIFKRWRKHSPQAILAWHRQVQKELLATLRAAPDEWFSGKERRAEWPFDLDGHSAYHRVKDIEEALRRPSQ